MSALPIRYLPFRNQATTMSPINGLWFAQCSECGYAVKGTGESDVAPCTNPGRRHLVRRPQRATATTSAAAEIYHALDFRTYAEYRRSAKSVSWHQRYYGERSRTSLLRQTRGNPSQVGKTASKHASERYLEALQVVHQAHQAVLQKERNLYQFYSNIHPDQRFYFDRTGADLQSLLLQYAEMLNYFFTEDPQADLWRSILHERCQLEDEVEFADSVIQRYKEIKGQNVLKWNEISDIENRFSQRRAEIQARIGEYEYLGTKEKTFQEGCTRIDQFLSEIHAAVSHVNCYITDGGVEGLKWFQDYRSRKIYFYSLETGQSENVSRRSRKSSLPHEVTSPQKNPWPQVPKDLRKKPTTPRPKTPQTNRSEMLLVELESDVDHGSDLEFRRTYGQKLPKSQGNSGRKNVSWADLNQEREIIKQKEEILGNAPDL